MPSRVSTVVSTGLTRGRYYRVFVSQVNNLGVESEKSDPVVIRVGDTIAPALPHLQLDTSFGASGFMNNVGLVDIGLKWERITDEDFDHYVLYSWINPPQKFTSDGEYNKSIATTAVTHTSISGAMINYVYAGARDKAYIYLGLQSVDVSGNASNIYVIKVLAEDTSVLPTPTAPILLEPGVWSIKLTVECPISTQIGSIIFWRDNHFQLPPVLFHSGLNAILYDTLVPTDGLTHFYTYAYVSRNGVVSPRSVPSATATARSIDTTMLDLAMLEALNRTWNTANYNDINQLKQDLLIQAQTISEQAELLRTVTENYNAVYNNYTILANNFSVMSASVERIDSTLNSSVTSLQTQINSNSKEILLRALKTETDAGISQLHTALAASIQVEAERISSVVAKLNVQDPRDSGFSAITQLYNGLQLKVSQGDLINQINMSPSGTQIDGKFLHVTGATLFDSNVRVKGTLYAGDVKLLDMNGALVWGSGSGAEPVVNNYEDNTIIREGMKYPSKYYNFVWYEPEYGGA